MGKGKEIEFPEGQGRGTGEPGVPPRYDKTNFTKITCTKSLFYM